MRKTQIALTIAALALALGWLAPPAADAATLLTASDGVIRNSLCVGFDCPGGPSFSDSTVLLVENNTRIKFDDTSSTSSFPRNDWELQANSSTNGGGNFFAINDCGESSGGGCADDPLFKVEAGARANALYVESDGDIGIGTNNPVVDIHVVTGNTPALRLAQDGSAGFTPQTWDVAGNETNFFVRDATSGSTLPLRIRAGGAPSSSIDIASDGDVGFGTSSPSTLTGGNDASIHVRRTDANASILIEDTSSSSLLNMMELRNNGPMRLVFENTSNGQTWDFRQNAGGDFAIVTPDAAGTEFLLDEDGNLAIQGQITTSGSCSIGCDRVFSPEYVVESIDEHAAAMWRNSHLPAVGPTPEDGPFNLTQKTGGMLNELEKAHIYIEQLHRRLADKEVAMANLEQQQLAAVAHLERQLAGVATLEHRLAALEAAMTATP